MDSSDSQRLSSPESAAAEGIGISQDSAADPVNTGGSAARAAASAVTEVVATERISPVNRRYPRLVELGFDIGEFADHENFVEAVEHHSCGVHVALARAQDIGRR